MEKRARERQGIRTDLLPHGAKSTKPIDVREELAQLAHVSHTTIYRAEFVMKYADEKRQEDSCIHQKVVPAGTTFLLLKKVNYHQ